MNPVPLKQFFAKPRQTWNSSIKTREELQTNFVCILDFAWFRHDRWHDVGCLGNLVDVCYFVGYRAKSTD